MTFRYMIYANVINENFTGLEYEKEMDITNITGGIRLYKINNINGIFVMRKIVYKIFLEKHNNIIRLKFNYLHRDLFYIELDLFDYKSNILFSWIKNDFMNISNIYCFRINKLDSKNHYEFYDYQEEKIKRMLSYYDESNSNIIIIYQSEYKIKYFSMKFIEYIYNINEISNTIEIKTYEKKEYNVDELINGVSNIGQLNIEGITKNINGLITTENFGINIYNLLMKDNILIPEKSFNTWYNYSLSFIDHVKNEYTRIYYLNNVNVNIKTCFSQECISCWGNYSQCDEYGNGAYALLIDDDKKGYPINKLVKGYVYNDTTKYFEKCYHSCDFCYESSNNQLRHKCESCANGYLHSYAYPGNCYKLNNLQINEEKINNGNENYIQYSCSLNKIYSTGECIDLCPTFTSFYIYEYNNETEEYYKVSTFIPPKYLLNKNCYESCPLDDNIKINDISKTCECKYAFKVEDNILSCFSNDNCISENNYQNPDTKECYSSLDDCFLKENNYFFNKFCYKNGCPENTVPLSKESEIIQDYFKTNLFLEDNLINKICICDTSNNTVWINRTYNEKYFLECLNECPERYIPEEIANQCIEKIEILPTTQIEMPVSQIEKPTTNQIKTQIEIPVTQLEMPKYEKQS